MRALSSSPRTLRSRPSRYSSRESPPEMGAWMIDSLPEALLCSVLGAGVLLVALHVANAFGWIWSQLAVLLLGGAAETTTEIEPDPVNGAA